MKIGDHVFAYFEGNRALPRITGYGIVTEIRGYRLVAVELDDDAMPPDVRGHVVLFDVDKVQAANRWAYKQLNGSTIPIADGARASMQHGTVTIPTAELERLTREAYEAGVRATMASMGVVQVSNTDDGLQAYGHNMTPAEARELARRIVEAADALDPFTEEPDGADDWIDPPKCDECKGTGIDIVTQIDDCPKCLGAGY